MHTAASIIPPLNADYTTKGDGVKVWVVGGVLEVKSLLLPILKYGCYNGHTMKLSREEVLHIARLARLGLTEAEVDRLREQLSNILENFEVLQKVDTTDIPPTAQPIPLQNVTKDDEVAASLPPGQILANAPRKDGEYFRVKAVLE
jgi:aspartyl-tRNA(Asn)/glutamyl-tRNA(Gln) amidotransferase subunit C